jgi:glycerate dehydrogenase
MRVVAASRSRLPGTEEGGVGFLDIDQLFRTADVVSLHCPLTPDTTRLVNATRLATMKPTAYLINTARGGLVDEQALADALAAGTIAGAGLDVLTSEPPRAGSPLLTAPRCVVTPHVAWATRKARARLIAAAADNLAAFQMGRPRNVVGP